MRNKKSLSLCLLSDPESRGDTGTPGIDLESKGWGHWVYKGR